MKRIITVLITLVLILMLSVSSISAYKMPEGKLVTLNEGEVIENALGFVGDADLNGKVNIRDATTIQKHLANIINIDKNAEILADADMSGKITVKDATQVQKFLAGISTEAPVYHGLYATDDEARLDFMLGTWNGKINISEEINKSFAESSNKLGFEFKDIEIGVILKLNEDLTYSLEYDDSSFETTLRALKDEYAKGMKAFFEKFIKDNNLETTVEEILKTSGYNSMDEFVDSAVSEEKLEALMDIDTVKGKFIVEKNTVYITNSSVVKDEYVGYFDYGFYDTNLMIENGNLFENRDFYPIIFERQ